MLDREGKNIDAVTIGIPDFMHATVALASFCLMAAPSVCRLRDRQAQDDPDLPEDDDSWIEHIARRALAYL